MLRATGGEGNATGDREEEMASDANDAGNVDNIGAERVTSPILRVPL